MNEMKQTIEILKQMGVFVRELQSSEIPFHSKYMITSAKTMTEAINTYITEPKLRSKKWLSTSLLDSRLKDKTLKYASAEYFVHNLISPVHFYDQLKQLP